ncbi:hypothetical protein TRIP_B50722 [uncultured Desulfatiglans sp.]|nr:hypothetical protein TRIP_B50722 [uncultured Desulfatiglans sp.]
MRFGGPAFRIPTDAGESDVPEMPLRGVGWKPRRVLCDPGVCGLPFKAILHGSEGDGRSRAGIFRQETRCDDKSPA